MRGRARANKILNNNSDNTAPIDMVVKAFYYASEYRVITDKDAFVVIAGEHILEDIKREFPQFNQAFREMSAAKIIIKPPARSSETFLLSLSKFTPYYIFSEKFDAILEAFNEIIANNQQLSSKLSSIKKLAENSRGNYILYTYVSVVVDEPQDRSWIAFEMKRIETKKKISRAYTIHVYTPEVISRTKSSEYKDDEFAVTFVPFSKESIKAFEDTMRYALKNETPEKLIEILRTNPLRTIVKIMKKHGAKNSRKIFRCMCPMTYFSHDLYTDSPELAFLI